MRSSTIGLVMATLVVLPPGGTFVDDDGSVHEGSIEAVAAADVTKGCNPPLNSRYCPGDAVTRGQMATFLSRALHLEAALSDHFIDDDSHLFEGAINRLATAGITLGCNPPANDRFCPDREMTRGEMAAMLVRAFDYPAVEADRFVDDDHSIFEDAIDRLAAAGITYGCNPPVNDRFCPGAAVSRAEMASFLTRALNLDPITPPDRLIPLIEVESRESWGAQPARPHLMHLHAVEQMTIHHAGSQSGSTGAAQFRGWQNWHMSGQGWGDIAYHLIIGVDGTVHEARDPDYEGDSGTPYDTTGHLLVVLEGNFDHEKPTQSQLESLTGVLAWASEEYGIPTSTIAGHRDHAATTCPGTHLHALIESGDLRDAVDDLISEGGVDLVWP
jgi:hypothetical protein